jgi:hypothetical protein
MKIIKSIGILEVVSLLEKTAKTKSNQNCAPSFPKTETLFFTNRLDQFAEQWPSTG